jgi:hypothetical protein
MVTSLPPKAMLALSLSSGLGWRGASFLIEAAAQLCILLWVLLQAIAGVADYLAWKLDAAAIALDNIQGRITHGRARR